MKKIFLFFSLLSTFFLIMSNAWATPTLLSNTCIGASNSGGPVTTTAINTTGANFIVVAVGFSPGTTPTISDSSSNTWSSVAGAIGGGSPNSYLFYVNSPTTSASQTFTAGPSGTHPGVCVMAFSGVGTPDVSGGATSYGSSETSFNAGGSGGITTNFNGELVVTSIVANNSGTTFTGPGSFTIPTGGQLPGISSQYYGLGVAYYIQPTAANIGATWGLSPTTTCVGQMASFQAGGSTPNTSLIVTINKGTVNAGIIN